MKEKMTITDWARVNGMTPDEFIIEIARTMSAIGAMMIEKEEGDDTKEIIWRSVDLTGKKTYVIVGIGEPEEND